MDQLYENALRSEREHVIAERDHWIRLFNRLEAAVSHHKMTVEMMDDHFDLYDEALWDARDKILKVAADGKDSKQSFKLIVVSESIASLVANIVSEAINVQDADEIFTTEQLSGLEDVLRSTDTSSTEE